MIKTAWLTFCLLAFEMVLAQESIHGKIISNTGEPISDVYVEVLDAKAYGISDNQGLVSLSVPDRNILILCSHLAFQDTTFTFDPVAQKEFEIVMRASTQTIETIEVIHHWADEKTPMTFSEYRQEDFTSQNLGQDVPYLLRRAPSLVVTSDAGHGIGYTGMRIRGTDPTRINITINGVPLNDSESQGVFWVDLPDFGSSVSNIQIQRGAGSSTNGTGAFGATVNLNTQSIDLEPQASISLGAGSFNSQKYNAQVSTGLLDNKFSLEGRLSKISSQGYIDRAESDLNSYYLSGTYLTPNASLRLNIFSGHEITYQAWNGVPAQFIDDLKLRTTNTAGTERPGTPHPNEVDDYKQTHYQLLWNQQFNNRSNLQATLHYTKGAGFFEQYKADQNLSAYQISEQSDIFSDLIRRRWLDNDFFGLISSYRYDFKQWQWTVGLTANQYLGNHFGEVIWARTFMDAESGQRYYDNDATKNELASYSKWLVNIQDRFTAYADIQYRLVDYSFQGINDNGDPLNHQIQHHFVNPKLGISFFPVPEQKWYASFAVAHREPNRNDYTDSGPSSWPQAERLLNTELGYQFQNKKLFWAINGYHMYYRNQLVLTGELNDVGAYVRTNVDKSYRIGLEAQVDYQMNRRFNLGGNFTISQNKIVAFKEFIDDWDDGKQQIVEHSNTDLAFSPNFIGQVNLIYAFLNQPNISASILWDSKWIGKQYLDNTSNEVASIPAYWVNDLTLNFDIQQSWFSRLQFNLKVFNILNELYSANGWVYRFNSDGYNPVADDPHARAEGNGFYNLAGYYTQATRYFMTGLTITL